MGIPKTVELEKETVEIALALKKASMEVYKNNVATGFWKIEAVEGLMRRLEGQIAYFEQRMRHILIVTTETHWDCNCDNDYIRCAAKELRCSKCGAEREECPHSRVSEVEGAPLREPVSYPFTSKAELNTEGV